MPITTFPSTTNPKGTRHPVTELLAALQKPLPRSTPKALLPLWSPGTFVGNQRNRDNGESFWALGYDVDEVDLSEADLRAGVGDLGALYHCSANHTPDKPRWRLFIPLSRPVTGGEYERLWHAVAQRLHFVNAIGQASSDCARQWYWPREPKEGAFVWAELKGLKLDVEELLKTAPTRAEVSRHVEGQRLSPTLDPGDPAYAGRLAAGEEAAKTLSAAADGRGSAIMPLARKLAGELELSTEDCVALIEAHWNPRYTNKQGVLSPQSGEEVLRAVLRAYPSDPVRLTIEGRRELDDMLTPEAKQARREARFEAAPPPVYQVEVSGRLPTHTYEVVYGITGKPENLYPIAGNVAASHLTGMDSVCWKGVLRYDTFLNRVTATRPPTQLHCEGSGQYTDSDDESISFWFATRGLSISASTLAPIVKRVARNMSYNSLEEYFRSLPTSEGAIAELCDILGQTTELGRRYVRLTLLGSVRRALNPGCKMDTVLVLKGKPGIKKSSFLKALWGTAYVSEDIGDISKTKDAGEVMQGVWCGEIAEMEAVWKANRKTVCAFITRRSDRYRAAYARHAEHQPRCGVLVGTTNSGDIYSDEESADVRRLWVVDLPGNIDSARVRAIRDRVWSEAYAACAGDVWAEGELIQGPPHFFTSGEEAEHVEYAAQYDDGRNEQPWLKDVAKVVEGVTFVENLSWVYEKLVPDVRDRKNGRQDLIHIGKCMRQLGYKKSTRGLGNCKRTNVWALAPQ